MVIYLTTKDKNETDILDVLVTGYSFGEGLIELMRGEMICEYRERGCLCEKCPCFDLLP